MKKAFITLLAGIIAAASLVSCGSAGGTENNTAATTTVVTTEATSKPEEAKPTEPVTSPVKFDFEQDDCGFFPIFADYPTGDGVEEFYELDHAYTDVPVEGAGKGLYISGNNHSDDLFMGYYRELRGFEAGKSYTFNISFKLATNIESGLIGIGGGPGESVYVKCGMVSYRPESVTPRDDFNNYRLNIDKGNQATGGQDMQVVGNLAKNSVTMFDAYEFNYIELSFTVTANADGCVYLIIGTDSGFEGTSNYYLDDIELSWN